VFSLTSECPQSLPAGKACALGVNYKPVVTGHRTAWVEVVLGANLVQRRNIAGTGVLGEFNVAPTSFSFGYQGINTTSAGKYVTVTNVGSGQLPVKSIYLSGQDAWQFVRAHNCPSTIPVGGACTVRVYFKPWTVGAKTATLTVWGGGGAGPKLVALTGTGATPEP
jgi:hypothetical protein